MKLFLGVYPAIVRDCHDPMRSGRVKVECPAVYGTGGENWSPWCLPKHQAHHWSVPLEGTRVWVSFRHGDPRYPIYEGYYTTYSDKGSPAAFRALSEGPYKDDLRDAADHQTTYDNNDHAKGHDHKAGEYWNPYARMIHYPMGAGWLVDEEPGEQKSKLYDRIGQYLEMVGDPSAPKDPHDETRKGGTYVSSDLDDGNVLYTDEGFRSRLTLRGTHNQRLEMTVADADQEETLSLVNQNDAGNHGSKLVASNSKVGASLLLKRFIPGMHESYEQKLDPVNSSLRYQRLFDWHGQQFEIHSDDEAPDRWIQALNGLGDKFRIDWDGRFIEVTDHNGQQIYYNTDEASGTRHVEMKTGAGESLKLELDGQKATLKDRLGNTVVLDAAGDTLKLTHSSGAEEVTLSAGGVSVSTAAGMTVNGRLVTLNGDPVDTPMGPGVAQGVGK